jgi:hypothetical protein
MADAYWMQLGGNLAFALEVGGRIVGVTYWVEGLPAEGAEGEAPPPESGWFFLATTLPRRPQRVARGLELRRDMTEEEFVQTVEQALEHVANAVLPHGGEE